MNINGYLMSKDNVLAEITNNKITVVLPELLPFYFTQPEASLSEWLRMRSIDTKRTNSRLLRKTLGLADETAESLVLSVNGATLTDTYWIKETGSALEWKNVCFTKNEFYTTALFGTFSDYNKDYSRTPELTNTGSFEKAWIKDGEDWWLYKVGYPDNLFSEMVAFRLCEAFGYPTAYYEITSLDTSAFQSLLRKGQGLIRTKDFTGGAEVNLEPAISLGLKNEDVGYNYTALEKLSPALATQYFALVTMDVLIYNLDRHNHNFAVLRDVDTGEIRSLAPNYDNNLALLSGIHGMEQRTEQTDRLFREWKQLVQSNFLEVQLPPLSPTELHELIMGIPIELELEEKQKAEAFILQGYQLMEEVAEQMALFHKGQGHNLI